jgi:hypothetical protein
MQTIINALDLTYKADLGFDLPEKYTPKAPEQLESDVEVKPDKDNDIFIMPSGAIFYGYPPTFDGLISHYSTDEDAEDIIKAWMDDNQYWPAVWNLIPAESGDQAHLVRRKKAQAFELPEKYILEREEEDEEFEPDEHDIFMYPSGQLGSRTSVSAGGKFLGEFSSDEEAEEAIKEWMEENKWWPNVWRVSDHGNIHGPIRIDAQEFELPEKYEQEEELSEEEIYKEDLNLIFDAVYEGDLRVYDNAGTDFESFDRYTVIYKEDAYGMSHNPTSPQGFNQYIGDKSRLNYKNIGRLLLGQDIPKELYPAIVPLILEEEDAD